MTVKHLQTKTCNPDLVRELLSTNKQKFCMGKKIEENPVYKWFITDQLNQTVNADMIVYSTQIRHFPRTCNLHKMNTGDDILNESTTLPYRYGALHVHQLLLKRNMQQHFWTLIYQGHEMTALSLLHTILQIVLFIYMPCFVLMDFFSFLS